jgi:hypothetical protein
MSPNISAGGSTPRDPGVLPGELMPEQRWKDNFYYASYAQIPVRGNDDNWIYKLIGEEWALAEYIRNEINKKWVMHEPKARAQIKLYHGRRMTQKEERAMWVREINLLVNTDYGRSLFSNIPKNRYDCVNRIIADLMHELMEHRDRKAYAIYYAHRPRC